MHWKLSIWQWRFKRWRKDRQEIKSLRKAINQVERKYAPRFAAAEVAGDEILIDDYLEEVSPYQPKLDYLKSQKLLEKARKLGIEVSPDRAGWFTDSYDCYRERAYKVLSQIGEARLRNIIRKQERDNWEWWLKVITAFTGLIGALIGLVAILK